MSRVRVRDIPGVRIMTERPQHRSEVSILRLAKTLDEYVAECGLQLDPGFQRPYVWDQVRQVRFIEYLLRGGDDVRARTIMLNAPNWDPRYVAGEYSAFTLVDGKQRLNAIRKFVANELIVFSDYRCSDLLFGSMDHTISIHVNHLRSEREVLQWYLDINESGVAHSDEELNRVRGMIAQIDAERGAALEGRTS